MSSFMGRLVRFMRPDAVAHISGSAKYPAISGRISFCQTSSGVIVVSDVRGLPDPGTQCNHPIFGMHIHAGTSCTGTPEEPFKNADGHFNPQNCSHPNHAGDLPPLFSNKGFAFSAVLTDRFDVGSVIGKTVIIHAQPDDFHTQPSGNSGEMIACGIIR